MRHPIFVAGFASANADDPVLAKLPVRGLDPIARAMIAAIANAAKQGGLELGRRTFDRIGCWAGVIERPVTSTKLYEDGFYERGGLAVSPEAFSRTVMSAPAGAASRVLGLRGPTATLSSGPGSGLLAIALAAIMLAQRDDADAIFAGDASDESASFAMLTKTAPTGGAPAIAIEALDLASSEPDAPSLAVALRALQNRETTEARAREGTCALFLRA